jgi:hypothetical protein
MTKQIKISKEDKMETINFFLRKKGMYCKTLTLKQIEEVIVKHSIDFDKELVSMKEEKEQQKRKDEEEDELRKEEKEKERLNYEKLHNSIKIVCEKKFVTEEYMEELKGYSIRIREAKKMIELSLRNGGHPCSNYIENGNAIINGVVIMFGYNSWLHPIIYKNSFIKELIDEFKVVIKRKNSR